MNTLEELAKKYRDDLEIEKAYWSMWRRRIGDNAGTTITLSVLLLILFMVILINPVEARDVFVGVGVLFLLFGVVATIFWKLNNFLVRWGKGENK